MDISRYLEEEGKSSQWNFPGVHPDCWYGEPPYPIILEVTLSGRPMGEATYIMLYSDMSQTMRRQ